MNATSLSSLLHLQGLPPLPRSLSGYANPSSQNQKSIIHPSHGSPQNYSSQSQISQNYKSSAGIGSSRTGPVPPPRPHSRRSSSSGSSFRASPENRGIIMTGASAAEGMRCSPRSLSSSPHSPHNIDSGLGRSSADSFSSEPPPPPRAFVRVVKSPTGGGGGNKLDAQLSQLRRDMQHLRVQDMSLLGHLLQINQGIQDLKNVLVPPPQPAPSMPMFHSTPVGYSSLMYGNINHGPLNPPPRNPRKNQGVSRGAKLFARRSSDKMHSDGGGGELLHLGAVGGLGLREKDEDDSDSLSSLEFGDV